MKEPIRVLHILQRMEAGGIQAFLMNIYRKIDRSKIQFDFLVHYTEEQFYDKEIESLGGKIYRLSVREDYNLLKYIRDLNVFFKKHTEYKIVHGHMYTLGFFYLGVAKLNHIPIRIAHSHENSSEKNIKWIFKKIMAKTFPVNATHLFACSNEAGNYLFGKRAFNVWNNAIDAKKFVASLEVRQQIRDELQLEDKFVVGHVGRFHPSKNHKFLINIFKEIKQNKSNAILLLIGSGEREEEIREQIATLSLQDDVIFLGNRSDMGRIFQAMDVFLFPSLFEGLGIVAIEAQAAGIPCICSNTVPKETKITPLISYLSLQASMEEWAQSVIEQNQNEFSHNNMYEYIVQANFDMNTLVNQIQTYYLEIDE